MAIFKGRDLEAALSPYKEHIALLKEHIERLEKENKALMETLVAIKSPDAYREMKAEEAALANHKEPDPDSIKKQELRHRTQQKWFENLENPTFNSFDEFEGYLRRKNPPTDKDVESESLHSNDES